jgi:pimeloyl-ACP methyl ester carboxylesterase
MNSAFQLILLPGLGADHRLLEPQRAAFPQLVVPPWIPPRKNESLPEYAARMAETVVSSRDEPLILGGVSFGGMLAYEMARRLKPNAVVLIASCRTRQSLHPSIVSWRGLLPMFPACTWSFAKLFAGPAMRITSRMSPSQQELLVTMFKEMDSRFMRWVVQAIMRWDPTPLEGVPVFQIHGGRDRIIPARRVAADVLIPDGSHMINVTHADEVNRFLGKAVEC